MNYFTCGAEDKSFACKTDPLGRNCFFLKSFVSASEHSKGFASSAVRSQNHLKPNSQHTVTRLSDSISHTPFIAPEIQTSSGKTLLLLYTTWASFPLESTLWEKRIKLRFPIICPQTCPQFADSFMHNVSFLSLCTTAGSEYLLPFGREWLKQSAASYVAWGKKFSRRRRGGRLKVTN